MATATDSRPSFGVILVLGVEAPGVRPGRMADAQPGSAIRGFPWIGIGFAKPTRNEKVNPDHRGFSKPPGSLSPFQLSVPSP